MSYRYLNFVIIIPIFILTHSIAYSQTNSIALTVQVLGVEGTSPNGTVVVLEKGVYKVAEKKADSNTIGVITNNPAITLRRSSSPNVFDLITQGVSQVRASNSGGKISKGDFVTSSDTKGVAIKSSSSEFVLGVALEDFDSPSGLMRIEVDPKYIIVNASTGTNLISVIRNSSQSMFLAPVDSLRYILAAIVAIASFVFGFSIFGKITGSGIQALARNPLARSSIQTNIVIEFGLNIAIIVFGIVVSYFILTI